MTDQRIAKRVFRRSMILVLAASGAVVGCGFAAGKAMVDGKPGPVPLAAMETVAQAEPAMEVLAYVPAEQASAPHFLEKLPSASVAAPQTVSVPAAPAPAPKIAPAPKPAPAVAPWTEPAPRGPRFDHRPLRKARTIQMVVTGYSPDERSCGASADGITASGYSVWTNGMKMVAADTRVLPFGSVISIPGYDEGRPVPVLDRGGAIKGNRLDLLFPTHEEALVWGRRTVTVTVWEYADKP